MFGRLLPECVVTSDQLIQHVIREWLPPSGYVRMWCGAPVPTRNLDPRCMDEPIGAPCVTCVRVAPKELIKRLDATRPPLDPLAARGEPAGAITYAACLAGLRLRHIVPEGAPRWPLTTRNVLAVYCGHLGWCPTDGPEPPNHWPVCAGCWRGLLRHTQATPGTPLP